VTASPSPLAPLHARFLSLLPRIEQHGRIYFRGLKCPHRKAEALAEVRALAWQWFLRVAQQGRDAGEFVTALATFAARAVNSGRRLCGMEKARDVLSPVAQQRHRFAVEQLPASTATSHEALHGDVHGQRQQDAFEERLRDNTRTPVPEQAAFRIDFPAWLRTLTARERRLIRAMARNERTLDLSRQFAVSPGRISQLRRAFHADWERFCADPGADVSDAAV
jgi:hypothetical protein